MTAAMIRAGCAFFAGSPDQTRSPSAPSRGEWRSPSRDACTAKLTGTDCPIKNLTQIGVEDFIAGSGELHSFGVRRFVRD